MSQNKAINNLEEAEKELYYWNCLIRSMEAKLERIEPQSFEFEALMEQLFTARDSRRKAASTVSQHRYFEACRDFSTYCVKAGDNNV